MNAREFAARIAESAQDAWDIPVASLGGETTAFVSDGDTVVRVDWNRLRFGFDVVVVDPPGGPIRFVSNSSIEDVIPNLADELFGKSPFPDEGLGVGPDRYPRNPR